MALQVEVNGAQWSLDRRDALRHHSSRQCEMVKFLLWKVFISSRVQGPANQTARISHHVAVAVFSDSPTLSLRTVVVHPRESPKNQGQRRRILGLEGGDVAPLTPVPRTRALGRLEYHLPARLAHRDSADEPPSDAAADAKAGDSPPASPPRVVHADYLGQGRVRCRLEGEAEEQVLVFSEWLKQSEDLEAMRQQMKRSGVTDTPKNSTKTIEIAR